MVFYFDAGQQRALRDRVDFFVTNLPTFDGHSGIAGIVPDINVRMAELSGFFTVFSFNCPINQIRYVETWDDALARGNKDFCLIQNCGHFFYGYDQLSADLVAALDSCAFMMGHIMDRGGYFYMHDQCVLINRRAWEQIGRPPMGIPEAGQRQVAFPHRSPDNVHDNYTPLFLDPLGKQAAIAARFGYGWNGISAGLSAGLRIVNWPEGVRRWKHNCYAYYGDIAEWVTALSDVPAAPETADVQLNHILQFLRNTPDREGKAKHIFVFNSEPDIDVPRLSFRSGIDSAFVLASGFKGNRLLETLGFHDGTKVVVYDYSTPALALRKMMVEEWDGRDFAAFMAAARPRIAAMFPDPVVMLPPEAVSDAAACDREFRREIGSRFASVDRWVEHWRRYRALDHAFVEIDMLRGGEAVRTMLSSHARGHCAMWFSDMFNSPNAVGKFSWAKRRAAFDVIPATLKTITDSHLLLGGEPQPWLPN